MTWSPMSDGMTPDYTTRILRTHTDGGCVMVQIEVVHIKTGLVRTAWSVDYPDVRASTVRGIEMAIEQEIRRGEESKSDHA